MVITCIGHSMFLLELANGMRIVTDPVDASSGYAVAPVKCDAVLVSHDHHDHAAMDSVRDYTSVVRTPGIHTLAEDVRVTVLLAYHDNEKGARRGRTLLFLIEAEGLRVVHLGDLGLLPDTNQISALAPVDVLLTPIGGFYTIDAAQARETARLLQARMILPMHYRTSCTADWPIAAVEDFTKLFAADDVSTQNLLRVTAGDLQCQKKVVVLQPRLKG